MAPANPRELSERELHEYVAEVEGHDSQVTGVVGYFYAMYRAEVLARVAGVGGRDILEIGCGEGMMFEGTGTQPVQMDVSMTRVSRAAGKCRFLLCADGYQLPFADESFEVVLLVAVLEHTREPWRILAEARRVLKPGGRVVMVVPNDGTMSAGRLLLWKFPIRYPDHLTFTTPGRMRRWLADGFRIREAFHLPVRWLPFAVNLYHFVVAEKRSDASQASRRRAGRRAGGHVGGVAAVGARHPRDRARARRRRRRHGQDDHGRRLLRRLRSAHVPHPRDGREPRDHEAIKPFFGDDPLILTRGTRVLLRGKEYVYPLEMLQVLTGVSPLLSARIVFDYLTAPR